MRRYRIGQFAKEMGVKIQTLRNWDKRDKLKPDYVLPSVIAIIRKNNLIII